MVQRRVLPRHMDGAPKSLERLGRSGASEIHEVADDFTVCAAEYSPGRYAAFIASF